MNIKSIILSFTILSFISVQSQELVAMFKDKAYWGFMNIKGEVIIKPQYTFCRDFRSGMAKVGKTTFINVKGEKLKSNVKFFDATQFNDGLLAVKLISGYWGFINKEGGLIIETKYQKVTDFNDGYALVMNTLGVYVIDKNGKETKINYEKSSINGIKHFSEGLAIIYVGTKFGFVNENGDVIVEPEYLSVGYYRDGLCWVRMTDGKIGYINKTGTVVIPPVFYAASEFDNGFARIKTKDGWGYINTKGELIPIDKSIEVFNEVEDGTALVRNEYKWGYLNPDGSWLIEPKFIKGTTSFQNGYARIEQRGKWGIINKKGEWVLNPIYDNIKSFYIVD